MCIVDRQDMGCQRRFAPVNQAAATILITCTTNKEMVVITVMDGNELVCVMMILIS